jgi:UDP-glucose 4-epimerase
MVVGILGSKGFIGGHLVDHYLTHGHDVIGLDNGSTGEYINVEAINYHIDLLTCTQQELIEIIGKCDVIIHLASTARVQPSFANPTYYFQNNLGNLVNVLNALKHWKGKFVYFSSSSVYSSSLYYGSSEENSLNPLSPYGLSKKMAEDMVLFYHQMFGLDVKIVRPFNVYGDRMSSLGGYSTAIQIFFDQFKAGKPLTVFGDGSQTRDFTHIQDIIQGLELVIQSVTTDLIFNIANGTPHSINSIVATFPYTCEVEYLPEVSEPKNTKGSILRIKSLGYSPKYNVLEWITNHL